MDSETGLVYFRNRVYSPAQGRFLQRDPLGYVDGLGLHEFVGGNPGNYGDPEGLELIRDLVQQYGPDVARNILVTIASAPTISLMPNAALAFSAANATALNVAAASSLIAVMIIQGAAFDDRRNLEPGILAAAIPKLLRGESLNAIEVAALFNADIDFINGKGAANLSPEEFVKQFGPCPPKTLTEGGGKNDGKPPIVLGGDDPWEEELYRGRSPQEIAEIQSRLNNWDQSTFGSTAESAVKHARKHASGSDYLKYMRRAESFNKKGAHKQQNADGTITWRRKDGQFLIERDGKIVTYGDNFK